MLEYQIAIERRRGPFGVLRRTERRTSMSSGSLVELPLNSGFVELSLDNNDRLNIKATGDQRVKVVFAAELQRFRPKVEASLNPDHPEIGTGRRKLTIYEEGDPSKRINIQAPIFEPLVLSRDEAMFMAGQEWMRQRAVDAVENLAGAKRYQSVRNKIVTDIQTSNRP